MAALLLDYWVILGHCLAVISGKATQLLWASVYSSLKGRQSRTQRLDENTYLQVAIEALFPAESMCDPKRAQQDQQRNAGSDKAKQVLLLQHFSEPSTCQYGL